MIGRLRIRLGLYVASEQPDDLGGVTTQWQLSTDLWAAITPRASTERGEAGRAAVLQTYKVVIRHRDDFPERARLLWGERILRVIAASDPDTRRERLHLICEEEAQ